MDGVTFDVVKVDRREVNGWSTTVADIFAGRGHKKPLEYEVFRKFIERMPQVFFQRAQ